MRSLFNKSFHCLAELLISWTLKHLFSDIVVLLLFLDKVAILIFNRLKVYNCGKFSRHFENVRLIYARVMSHQHVFVFIFTRKLFKFFLDTSIFNLYWVIDEHKSVLIGVKNYFLKRFTNNLLRVLFFLDRSWFIIWRNLTILYLFDEIKEFFWILQTFLISQQII